MSEGKIIVLPTGYDPEGDEAPIKRAKKEPPGPCLHRAAEIDKERRVLLCRRCDIEIDPFEWIEMLARDWQWYRTRCESADRRAQDAERSSKRRIDDAQRAARTKAALPMAIGKRLGRISRSIGRAQVELGEAFASLAEVHDDGRAPLADLHLSAAISDIERARSSLAKLIRDHGKPIQARGA